MTTGMNGEIKDQLARIEKDERNDRIPLVSSVTNIVDLVAKVNLPKNPAEISKDYYVTYLSQKSVLRCVVLLVPFIGNLVVKIYDLIKDNN